MEKSTTLAANSTKVNELIYYIYFFCLFGARAVGLYESQNAYNALLVAGALFFIVKVITTRHTVAELLASFALLSTGALTYICSGEKGLLIYFTMMLGMKGINQEKIMRIGLYLLGIAYFILYLLSVTGLITELNHMNKRSGYGFLLRHSLGYPYPNTAHTTLLILIILFFYLYKPESFSKLIKASIIATLINLYVYLYTVSLTGLISISIYLIVNIYMQKRTNRSVVENALIALLFPVTVIFSITGPLLAKGSIFTFMNKLLHKRYEFALYFLTNEKVTLFGSYFDTPPTNWYMLDNSFLYLFLQLGIIPFIIVCAIYVLWIKYLLKENKKAELAILITFCFIGMSDPFLFNLSSKNLTFVFIGSWFYETIDKKSVNLPDFLRKEILLLPFGEKEFTPSFDGIHSCMALIAKPVNEMNSHLVKYALIFAITGVIAATAYTNIATEPKVLYVSTAIADPYFSQKNIEMTPEDVDKALAKGNIVEDYNSEDPTMYVFKKSAPHMEFIRSAVTCGIFSGIILVLIASIIGIFRKR